MKGFIFDLDGTLSDSIPGIVDAQRKAFADFNIQASDELIISYIGRPLAEAGEEQVGPGRGQEFLEAYFRHYYAQPLQLQAFDGIINMLQELRQMGAKLALCTSKRRKATLETLDLIGIAPYLHQVVVCEDTNEHKPAAEPGLCAAQRLGLSPDQCVFIGDSIHDIGCGSAAGMKSCGVTWGANSMDQLLEAGADYIVDSVEELHLLLLSLCA